VRCPHSGCAKAKPLDKRAVSPIGLQICEHRELQIRPRKTFLAGKAIPGFKRLITCAGDCQWCHDETEGDEHVGFKCIYRRKIDNSIARQANSTRQANTRRSVI